MTVCCCCMGCFVSEYIVQNLKVRSHSWMVGWILFNGISPEVLDYHTNTKVDARHVLLSEIPDIDSPLRELLGPSCALYSCSQSLVILRFLTWSFSDFLKLISSRQSLMLVSVGINLLWKEMIGNIFWRDPFEELVLLASIVFEHLHRRYWSSNAHLAWDIRWNSCATLCLPVMNP